MQLNIIARCDLLAKDRADKRLIVDIAITATAISA